MSSPFIPCPYTSNDYSSGGNGAAMIISSRNPSSTQDRNVPSGFLWLSSLDLGGSGTLFVQSGNTSGAPVWTSLSSGAAGALNTLSDGTIQVSPSGGNIAFVGTGNQLVVTGSAALHQFNLSLANAIIAPGSLTTTTTLASGTTLTVGTNATVAGTMNITGTSTLGVVNINGAQTNTVPAGTPVGIAVDASAGTGVPMTLTSASASIDTLRLTGGGIKAAPTVVAAAASPQTCNNRFGQVTFSGVNIAAGATQSFVISNTQIAAIATVIAYSMVGGTTGSALTIQSVTNVAGTSSTIVVQNGTGATTTTANITFTFWVMN